MARIHIIGAGLAGLSAALSLSRTGRQVTLLEATRRAGGRCRSYHDDTLGCVLDNGNHLVMSGNKAAMAFLDEVKARDRMVGPAKAAFPFMDVSTGKRWTVRPNSGPIPWWVLIPRRGVPGANAFSYLPAIKLLLAQEGQTVADVLPAEGPLYRGLWEPLIIAAINAPADEAAAVLMKPVLLETFAKGSASCRPLIARHSLADSFIDPALDTLAARGVDVRFGSRIQSLERTQGRVSGLIAGDERIEIAQGDMVILAVPPWDAAALLPGLTTPPAGDPIVNVHFRLPRPPRGTDATEIIGIVGGFAQWIFVRGDVVSITISAARREAQMDSEDIAGRCWRDVRAALAITDEMPPYRVVKERRATFAQTPEAVIQRPDAATVIGNLFLAGDWTDTGLPATIEGAIRSGNRAAELASRTIGGTGS
ncbi:hydroxysqualene dehydroxylase HpnE [Iodidimonas sp. SYSU 1G8]|uniref:hydroxysqualene dehydroxylase HpnE n=1 Tax=Iodidimonas sp. SYSU 1G8 TaxID=3133967 RepID=UPI0031FED5A2